MATKAQIIANLQTMIAKYGGIDGTAPSGIPVRQWLETMLPAITDSTTGERITMDMIAPAPQMQTPPPVDQPAPVPQQKAPAPVAAPAPQPSSEPLVSKNPYTSDANRARGPIIAKWKTHLESIADDQLFTRDTKEWLIGLVSNINQSPDNAAWTSVSPLEFDDLFSDYSQRAMDYAVENNLTDHEEFKTFFNGTGVTPPSEREMGLKTGTTLDKYIEEELKSYSPNQSGVFPETVLGQGWRMVAIHEAHMAYAVETGDKTKYVSDDDPRHGYGAIQEVADRTGLDFKDFAKVYNASGTGTVTLEDVIPHMTRLWDVASVAAAAISAVGISTNAGLAMGGGANATPNAPTPPTPPSPAIDAAGAGFKDITLGNVAAGVNIATAADNALSDDPPQMGPPEDLSNQNYDPALDSNNDGVMDQQGPPAGAANQDFTDITLGTVNDTLDAVDTANDIVNMGDGNQPYDQTYDPALDSNGDGIPDQEGPPAPPPGSAGQRVGEWLLDAAGNLVDDAGNIVKTAGSWMLDAAGGVIDSVSNMKPSDWAGVIGGLVNTAAGVYAADRAADAASDASQATRDIAADNEALNRERYADAQDLLDPAIQSADRARNQLSSEMGLETPGYTPSGGYQDTAGYKAQTGIYDDYEDVLLGPNGQAPNVNQVVAPLQLYAEILKQDNPGKPIDEYLALLESGVDVTELPGYSDLITERAEAVNQGAAGSGSLYSGRRGEELAKVGGATQQEYYNNYMNRRGSIAGMQSQVETDKLGRQGNVYNSMSNIASKNIDRYAGLTDARAGTESKYFDNYMTTLTNMSNPSAATNLASMGMNQGVQMGQQNLAANTTASNYDLAGTAATNSAVADAATGVTNALTPWMSTPSATPAPAAALPTVANAPQQQPPQVATSPYGQTMGDYV
jgi:hypothetical protein